MKILLINPINEPMTYPTWFFPSSLGYIAAVLENAGHKVEILEINAYRYSKQKIESIIKKADHNLFGIGGVIFMYQYVLWLCDIIKKYHPSNTIVIGGNIASPIPELLLKKSKADIICVGEGEDTIVELANKLEKKESINEILGTYIRDGNTIKNNGPRRQIEDINKLPFPAYHLFPLDIYFKTQPSDMDLGKKNLSLISSRGCPYDCSFCFRTFRGIRQRSPKNVVDELIFLKKKYGITGFIFLDELTLLKKDWVLELCDLMIKNKLNLKWGCIGHASTITEEVVSKLKEAGCGFINIGVESADPRILKEMNKQITLDQVKKAVRILKKTGIPPSVNFIIGMPGEDEESVRKTVDFIKKLDVRFSAFFFVTPFPGTALYNNLLREGKIRDEEEFIKKLGNAYDFSVNLTKWSDGELFRIKKQAEHEIKKAYFKRHKMEYLRELIFAVRYFPDLIKKTGAKSAFKLLFRRSKEHIQMWASK